jgi:hypothetical protein
MDVIKTYIPKRFRNKKLVNTGSGSGSTTVINSGNDISPSSFVDSDTFYSMFELVDLSGTPAIKAKHEFFSVAGVTAYGTGTVATGGSGSSVYVLDVLNSTDTGSALSANMGRVLNEGKLNRSEISSWALGANKPTYDKTEIGGLTTALAGKSAVGHKHYISEIYDFAHVHQWNDIENKPSVITNTTASFTTALETKLNGIATGAEVNVNADWNATSGAALILNKPTTFSGTFYGNLIGNAASATGLQYARTIWGQAFDGNSNLSGTLDLGSGDLTWGGWGAGKATLAGVPNGVMIYPKGNAYTGEVYINGNLIYHTGNFTNLNQLTTRNFSDLQNKPTTIGGYGITDATPISTFNTHNNDNVRHITSQERTNWNGKVDRSGDTMTGNLTMGATTDIITNFNTWTNGNSKSLDKFLKLFDIDIAGNLVVKTNLYSTGEVTAYSSGTGVSGLTLMGDMDANGKSINNATSVQAGIATIRGNEVNTGLEWNYDGDSAEIASYMYGLNKYVYAGGAINYQNSILDIVGQVKSTEFNFGNWTFKQDASGRLGIYNGTTEVACFDIYGTYVNL